MEIVYCGGCGKVLREDDFSRGLARVMDNRPWCSECKPPDKAPIPPAAASSRNQGSSAKHPRINAGTARREAAPPGQQKVLLIGIGVAVVVLIALGAAMSGGSSPPPVERSVRPPVDPPKRGPDPADLERVLKDLEAFAGLSTPDKILARCDEVRPKLIGTPQARRFLAIEAAAKDQLRTRDQGAQFAKDLETLRKLIDADPRYAKGDEVERRLRSLRDIAGPRSGEIDRLTADYKRDRQISPHEKREGPFSEDDQGFIRNWLVLGVFPNDKDNGLDVDFLKTEAAADPLGGQTVGKLKWASFGSAESKIDFFRVGHLNIKPPKDNVVAYAYCAIQVPEQLASEIRVGSDDGQMLWVDGALVGKLHKSRSLKIDEDRYAVPLSPGLHRILIKVDNHLRTYEFALRIVTADGQPIPSIKVWN